MKLNLAIFLLFIGLALVLVWSYIILKNNSASRSSNSTAPAIALKSQSNEQGEVAVTITPRSVLPTAETWSFNVLLDTHSVELNEDMVSIAVLTGNGSEQYRSTGWQGDGPGGHHREGVLLFKPIIPMPTLLTLSLSNLGGVSVRTFSWQVTKN